ncbi:phosphohistidine phosphatase SixA [Candidatus Micrarchaeota archaeon]|nr:phosphohistidine phosphatase SixA [Candidatus Micrarchaeota archaeon]
MEIYLVQHGEAKPEEEDTERPLSPRGMKETSDIAKKLSFVIQRIPNKIFHSPKLRARQTAEILAKSLNCKTGEIEGLKPLDDPSIIKDKLSSLDSSGTYFFVGHLPNLEKLSSLLLYGTSGKPFVAFRNSAPLCITHRDGTWKLKYYFLPELL